VSIESKKSRDNERVTNSDKDKVAEERELVEDDHTLLS
jgi:hypothetical protein